MTPQIQIVQFVHKSVLDQIQKKLRIREPGTKEYVVYELDRNSIKPVSGYGQDMYKVVYDIVKK